MTIPPVDQKNFHFPEFKKEAGSSAISLKIYRAALKVAAFVAAGIICLFFSPPLAIPFFTIACVMLITELVVNIMQRYHENTVEKVLIKVDEFRRAHPYLQIAALVGIVITAIFLWPVACMLAIPFGIYINLVIELDFYQSLQAIQRRLGLHSANEPHIV